MGMRMARNRMMDRRGMPRPPNRDRGALVTRRHVPFDSPIVNSPIAPGRWITEILQSMPTENNHPSATPARVDRLRQKMARLDLDTFLVLMDVVNEFVMSAVSSQVNIVTSVDLPLNAQPFTARFANILTGWSVDLRIRTPFGIKLCDVKWNAQD